MSEPIEISALNQLFLEARTRNGWRDEPVSEQKLREIYDLAKMGPTSVNSCPARFVWVRSTAGKEKLANLAMDSNRAKIRAAPVTVIIGQDLDFADRLHHLFPAQWEVMTPIFKQQQLAEITAFRNSTLQGAYLMIAARALGLDAGPMSGFDNAGVDEAFFAGSRIKSNFICSLGYGNDEGLFPRNPRLAFDEAGWLA
ncbi:MAG: malonic semialdehyde reductase [Hyphomicrobiaceae bacterium]